MTETFDDSESRRQGRGGFGRVWAASILQNKWVYIRDLEESEVPDGTG